MIDQGFALFTAEEAKELFDVVQQCHKIITDKWKADKFKQAAVLTWLCNDFYKSTGIIIRPERFDQFNL